MQTHSIQQYFGFLILLLGTLQVFGQEEIRFQAFGHTPQTIPIRYTGS